MRTNILSYIASSIFSFVYPFIFVIYQPTNSSIQWLNPNSNYHLKTHAHVYQFYVSRVFGSSVHQMNFGTIHLYLFNWVPIHPFMAYTSFSTTNSIYQPTYSSIISSTLYSSIHQLIPEFTYHWKNHESIFQSTELFIHAIICQFIHQFPSIESFNFPSW